MLQKSLHGLKQTSRNWNTQCTTSLLQFRNNQFHAEHSLFIHHEGPSFVFVFVYVDDVIVIGSMPVLTL